MNQSLYIHIPFCQSKCGYCSFVSWAQKDHLTDTYVEMLGREGTLCHGVRFDSVYIGGGTPTYLNTPQMERLFDLVRSSAVIGRDAEFTVEVNPASCDAEKADLLIRQGVNRISLGVQSFDDHNLRWLGRPHSSKDARESFAILRGAGFKNINADLIYGLPGQQKKDVLRDVEELLALGGEHVSLYTLGIEEGSVFFERKTVLPSAEEQAFLYEAVTDALVEKGMTHYEVSNFAKSGFECRHNINYWLGGNYFGLGAGAHSHRDGKRSWNVSEIERYISMMERAGTALLREEKLSVSERFTEALLIGLRMIEGVDIRDLEQRFSTKIPDRKMELIEEFISAGFFRQVGPRLMTTREGLLVLDELSPRLA